MMLPWQLPSVAQTDRATAFAESSPGQGSISRGRERNWDGKRTFTEANLRDTRTNILARRQTLEKPPNKPKFGFLLARSLDHREHGLGVAIPLSATGWWQMGLLGILSFVTEELHSLVSSTRKRQV